MSVSDPLLKDLKGCVQQFLNLNQTGVPIKDNNFYFVFFSQTLEKILDKELIRQQNTKYFNRTIDAYAWLTSLVKANDPIINFAYIQSVDDVKDRKDLWTNDGRLRLLIKMCLMKKCWHVPFEYLLNSKTYSIFYTQNSIIGDEILLEILLSVLRQISKIKFSLDIQNSSFLDTGWYVPEIIEMELVPCRSLGISVSFKRNKAVIVNIEPNGVAAENGNIKLGDILDHLNGIPINSSNRGRLGLIMSCQKNKPIQVRIAKAYDKETGEIFEPLKILLKDLKIDENLVKNQYGAGEIGNLKQNEKPSVSGFDLKYLAKVNVGQKGSVKEVQKAIRCLTDNHAPDVLSITRVDEYCVLEIGELGVKVKHKVTSELLLDHSYMKISACGNIPMFNKVLAYCAGDENCDVAERFDCYVFETNSFNDADRILQSIGQGFQRTHFAV